jgi:DNA-binding NarL/FixJ family response regulator
MKLETVQIPSLSINLPPKQFEVLHLLCQGLGNKEIGDRLGKAEGTIKVQVRALLERWEFTNRTQLVVAAITGQL